MRASPADGLAITGLSWKGSRGGSVREVRGGRPPAFDAALYGLRNTVERGFHRLKQWRGIATRYDKYALTYLGGVLLACAVIHARVGTPKLGDTP
ncbi:transposase [Mycobacterium tuberculosis]|nr:transposase [Mycobacterium tuberculosis]